MNEDDRIRLAICRHLDISEQTFFDLAFDVFDFQASQFSDMLPHYLQPNHHEIFVKSVAFRKWFQIEKAENDRHILKFMERYRVSFKLTTHQYTELQNMYFEDRSVFPNSAVLTMSIRDYKNRVSIPA